MRKREALLLGAIAVLIVKDQDRMSKLSVILYILAFIIITPLIKKCVQTEACTHENADYDLLPHKTILL